MTITFRQICETAVGMCGGAFITTWLLKQNVTPIAVDYNVIPTSKREKRPSRTEQITSLRKGEEYDILIIGGGATGAGCALDAATRGLKTALVEADDFACGASSKSTKLIHGGVRCLQNAVLKLDYEQFKLVRKALKERGNIIESAPHLVRPISIMIPIYQWWKVPYFWISLKCYDFLSGLSRLNFKGSYFLSKRSSIEMFPMLNSNNLWGSIIYYEGLQDDARMCLAIALTAANYGATVCNHVEVKKLLKKDDGKGNKVLYGATVKDHISGKQFDVKAKCIINATGPLTDSIRQMDDSSIKPICAPSSGVHIVLPKYFCPNDIGLLDTSAPHDRLIFLLPWKGHTICGTTDFPSVVTKEPKPTEHEILLLINEIKKFFSKDIIIRRSYVSAAWSGIRPLVTDPNKNDIDKLSRNHIIHISPSKLITIAGGKWTTYRSMAEQTIDAAIDACNLKPSIKKSKTKTIKINGACNWTPLTYISLVQEFGMDIDVAQNLSNSYGCHAFDVAKISEYSFQKWPKTGKRILSDFPYIYAEIKYGIEEYACTATDMISRRIRLSFLNAEAALEVLPVIVDKMGEILNWSEEEKISQKRVASHFIFQQMGLNSDWYVNEDQAPANYVNLTNEEKEECIKMFAVIDKDLKGSISSKDIYNRLKDLCTDNSRLEFLNEMLVDSNTKIEGQFTETEFLMFMSSIKCYDAHLLVDDHLVNTEFTKNKQKKIK